MGTVTILGQHIDNIRPRKIHKPLLPKEEWKVAYDTTPKTREIGVAEFFKICLSFKDEIPRPKVWR